MVTLPVSLINVFINATPTFRKQKIIQIITMLDLMCFKCYNPLHCYTNFCRRI